MGSEYTISSGGDNCKYFNNICFSDSQVQIINRNGCLLRTLSTHRVVLSARSTYLSESFKRSCNVILILGAFPIEYLIHSIAFMYGCPISVKIDQLINFYEVGKSLGIEDLKSKIIPIIFEENFTIPQRISLLNTAWKIQGPLAPSGGLKIDSELKQRLAISLIALFDPSSNDFLSLISGEALGIILSSDQLKVRSEIEILRFLERWSTKVDQLEFVKALPFLRLPTILPEVKGMKLYDLLAGSPLNNLSLYRSLVDEAVKGVQQYGVIYPLRRNIPRTGVVQALLKTPIEDGYFARVEEIDCKRPDTEFSMKLSNTSLTQAAKLEKNSDLCAIPIGVGSIIEVIKYRPLSPNRNDRTRGIVISELVVIYPITSKFE